MKIILLILFIPFSIGISNHKGIVGKYEIEDEFMFSNIELREDKSYTYKYRGLSCWVWQDRIGKWEVDKNILILKDSFLWKEETTVLKETIDKTIKNEIRIKFIDAEDNPIEGIKVKYDDVSGSEFWQEGKTNEKGIVIFKPIKEKYYPENDRARLQFDFKEFEDNVSVDILPRLINNKITVIINSAPKSGKKERIEKYEIKGKELVAFEENSLDSKMKYKKNKKGANK